MKRDDRCAKYCGGIIAGIVEKVRRQSENGDKLHVAVTPVKGLHWVPAGSYEMKCPLHGNTFIVRPGDE